MIKKITALFILLFAFSTNTFAQEWKIDTENSRIGFEVGVEGGVISGSFEKFDAQISLNPDDTSSANIKAIIQASSLTADDRTASSTALGKAWLFAKQFPEIKFQSTSVTKLSEGKYEIEGTLSVKEISKTIKFPFTLTIQGEKAIASAKPKIERASFNLGGASEAVPHIQVGLNIVAFVK